MSILADIRALNDGLFYENRAVERKRLNECKRKLFERNRNRNVKQATEKPLKPPCIVGGRKEDRLVVVI